MDRKLKLSLLFQAGGNTKSYLGGMSRDADKAGRALADTRSRLQTLQRATRDVSAFKKLEGGLAATRQELSAARAEALRLGGAMDAAERPTKQLSRAFELATNRVRALETQQAGQVRGLAEMKTKLDAAGVSTDALGAHELRLARDLKTANGQLDEQARRLSQVNDRQRQMAAARGRYDRTQQMAGSMQGAGMSAIGVGAAVGAPLVASSKAAMELEGSMTTIAQRSNLSAEATTRFEKALLASGAAANRTRAETLNMFDQLTAQGIELPDALAMSGGLGKAATAYQIDDGELAATAASLRNIQVEAVQTGRALDVMAVAGKRGAFEFDAMARSFPSLTSGAARYGMTGLKAVAELASAAQIARKGAGTDDEAATNLGNLLQKIASPETERKFAKLGINLRNGLAAGAKEGKSALETIIELTQRATGGDDSKLGYLFEDAQVQKALLPLMANFAEFKKIRDDALGANGEVARDFARRMRDAGQGAKALQIEAGVASVRLGKDLMPAIRGVVSAADSVLVAYNNWAQANPGMARGVALVAAGVAAVAIAGGALALVIAAVLGPWALLRFALAGAAPMFAGAAGGIWAMTTAAWGFAAALLANPVTWIVAGVVALALAGLAIYRNWGRISEMFGGIWRSIRTAGLGAIASLTVVFTAFQPAAFLLRNFDAVWPQLSALGSRFLTMGGQLIMGLVRGVTGGIPAVVRAVIAGAGSIITGFKQRLGIRSPSRVFAQLGDYTMQGMGIGISRSSGGVVGRMRRAAGAVAAAGLVAMPSFASAAPLNIENRAPVAATGEAPVGRVTPRGHQAPARPSIGAVTINIVQRQGENMDELADRVAEHIGRRDLGRYSDVDWGDVD